MTPHVSGDPSVWIAALLTLAVLGFLVKDNPVWRFVEHLFVGVTAGWVLVVNWWTVIVPDVVRPTLDLAAGGRADVPHTLAALPGLVIPAALGVLVFGRLDRRTAWLARWPLAVVLGVYAGLRMAGFAEADLVQQLRATLRPLWTGDAAAGANAIVLVLGVATCLLFLLREREPRGVTAVPARIGTLFLMVAFGAAWGFTVMSRMSLLIGRFQFLLFDWLGLR
jgi:hypothetical protein